MKHVPSPRCQLNKQSELYGTGNAIKIRALIIGWANIKESYVCVSVPDTLRASRGQKLDYSSPTLLQESWVESCT